MSEDIIKKAKDWANNSYFDQESRDEIQNLIDQEVSIMTRNLKTEDKEKHKINNEKIAKSRIKLGLLLNEYGEKNNLKVSDDEVRNEIQKQIKGMPGQEKMVKEYYEKNPSAIDGIRGSIYEEKIIDQIKKTAKVNKKQISKDEAEKILKAENEKNLKEQEKLAKHNHDHDNDHDHNKDKKKSDKKETSSAKKTSVKKAKTVTKKAKATKKVSKK